MATIKEIRQSGVGGADTRMSEQRTDCKRMVHKQRHQSDHILQQAEGGT